MEEPLRLTDLDPIFRYIAAKDPVFGMGMMNIILDRLEEVEATLWKDARFSFLLTDIKPVNLRIETPLGRILYLQIFTQDREVNQKVIGINTLFVINLDTHTFENRVAAVQMIH